MPEIVITDVPDTVLSALDTMATDKALTVEVFATQLICDAIAVDSLAATNEITLVQFEGNMDAYFRLAESRPIFITDESGERFVLMSINEFDRLSGAHSAT